MNVGCSMAAMDQNRLPPNLLRGIGGGPSSSPVKSSPTKMASIVEEDGEGGIQWRDENGKLQFTKFKDWQKKHGQKWNQADFEKKAMQQEVHKVKEKLAHIAKKRMQEREKLFEDVVQIKMHMEKQHHQLL